MLKYYIYFAFHCFTQYYFKIKKYYQSLHTQIKNQIFLCALYKKGRVEELGLMLFLSIVPMNRLQDSGGWDNPKTRLMDLIKTFLHRKNP